jgi:hypothetical protein
VPVTLTLYVHDGNRDGLTITGATVAGHDGSGNSFQQTTDSNGYVTIEGDSGKWSFSASADGYETNDWDQDIPETDRKDASLQKEQRTSESSVIGKWDVHGVQTECKMTQEGHEDIILNDASSGWVSTEWDDVIYFNNDGSFTLEYVKDGVTETTTGEWTQYGNTVHLQYDPEPLNANSCLDCPDEDDVVETWQTEGSTEDLTINGDTMSGTGSYLYHTKSYSKQYPEEVIYSDSFCTDRLSATRIDTES